MPLIRAETANADLAAVANALLLAQDRDQANTPALLFAAVGSAASVANPDDPVTVTDPDAAAALLAAIAAEDGVAVTPEQIAAGLRAVGIYHRETPPLPPPRSPRG
jgi:hypothetical protein